MVINLIYLFILLKYVLSNTEEFIDLSEGLFLVTHFDAQNEDHFLSPHRIYQLSTQKCWKLEDRFSILIDTITEIKTDNPGKLKYRFIFTEHLSDNCSTFASNKTMIQGLGSIINLTVNNAIHEIKYLTWDEDASFDIQLFSDFNCNEPTNKLTRFDVKDSASFKMENWTYPLSPFAVEPPLWLGVEYVSDITNYWIVVFTCNNTCGYFFQDSFYKCALNIEAPPPPPPKLECMINADMMIFLAENAYAPKIPTVEEAHNMTPSPKLITLFFENNKCWIYYEMNVLKYFQEVDIDFMRMVVIPTFENIAIVIGNNLLSDYNILHLYSLGGGDYGEFRNQKQYILAFKGTDSIANLVQDYYLWRKVMPEYYSLALKALSQLFELKPEVKKNLIGVTGHSLGAFLAEVIGMTLNIPVYSFDSPGTKPFVDKLGLQENGLVHIFNGMPNLVNLCHDQIKPVTYVKDVVECSLYHYTEFSFDFGNLIAETSFCFHKILLNLEWASVYHPIKRIASNFNKTNLIENVDWNGIRKVGMFREFCLDEFLEQILKCITKAWLNEKVQPISNWIKRYNLNNCQKEENVPSRAFRESNEICSDGYFNYNGKCLQCDSRCVTCNDSFDTNCTSCSGFHLVRKNADFCLPKCPSEGYYTQNNSCIPCTGGQFCELCVDEKKCLTCWKTFVLKNDMCQCDDGFYLDKNNSKCEKCSENCLACENGHICTNCSAVTDLVHMGDNSTQCLEKNSNNKYRKNGIWYEKKYFFDISQNTMKSCITNCDLCINESECKVCSNELKLKGTTCIDTCVFEMEYLPEFEITRSVCVESSSYKWIIFLIVALVCVGSGIGIIYYYCCYRKRAAQQELHGTLFPH